MLRHHTAAGSNKPEQLASIRLQAGRTHLQNGGCMAAKRTKQARAAASHVPGLQRFVVAGAQADACARDHAHLRYRPCTV